MRGHKVNIDNIQKLPVRVSVWHRIPWLILGLMGGVFASKIVGSYRDALSNHLVIAGFIPLMVYMSDAVGTQMESIVIRDFALNNHIKFIKYFLNHLKVTLFIAIILSTLLYLYITFTYNDYALALAVSLSLFFSVSSSVVTGFLMAILFEKVLPFDPANASGPIATIMQDLISIIIYFAIVSRLL